MGFLWGLFYQFFKGNHPLSPAEPGPPLFSFLGEVFFVIQLQSEFSVESSKELTKLVQTNRRILIAKNDSNSRMELYRTLSMFQEWLIRELF